MTDPVRGQSGRADVLLQAGHAPSDALRRELVDCCRDRIAVDELPRDVECAAQLSRAPGPARPRRGPARPLLPRAPGPAGPLRQRVLRERAAQG